MLGIWSIADIASSNILHHLSSIFGLMGLPPILIINGPNPLFMLCFPLSILFPLGLGFLLGGPIFESMYLLLAPLIILLTRKTGKSRNFNNLARIENKGCFCPKIVEIDFGEPNNFPKYCQK